MTILCDNSFLLNIFPEHILIRKNQKCCLIKPMEFLKKMLLCCMIAWNYSSWNHRKLPDRYKIGEFSCRADNKCDFSLF